MERPGKTQSKDTSENGDEEKETHKRKQNVTLKEQERRSRTKAKNKGKDRVKQYGTIQQVQVHGTTAESEILEYVGASVHELNRLVNGDPGPSFIFAVKHQNRTRTRLVTIPYVERLLVDAAQLFQISHNNFL